MRDDLADHFGSHGYVCVPGVLDQHEVAALQAEADRLFLTTPAERQTTESRWLHTQNDNGSHSLRGVQSAHLLSASLREVRADQRVGELLAPLIGHRVTSPVNTLFWKPPGQGGTNVAYHQDCAFRRPRTSFRNLETSYVQVGFAIDRHGPANGGMRVVPGSHRLGELSIDRSSGVLTEAPHADVLRSVGLHDRSPVDLELEAGDVVMWCAFLVHGSPANRARSLGRTFFVAAYMRSSDCDVGDPVFTA